MYVKPVPGRSVPDPLRGDLLPDEGREVAESSYWLRRIDDNDVALVDPKTGVVQTPAQG